METEYKVPENAYVGFGSIGGTKRENKVDPVEEIEDEKNKDSRDKKEIKESLDDVFDSLEKTTNLKYNRRELSSAKFELQSLARAGFNHHTIMDAAKHIEVPENKDLDKSLEDKITNTHMLSPELHEDVRKALRAAPDNKELRAKYAWVFKHPNSHENVPTYNEDNVRDLYLDPEHIKKYSNDGYSFLGGRVMSDNVTGAVLHLNKDGSVSPTSKSMDTTAPDFKPWTTDHTGSGIKYNHDNLSEYYEGQLNEAFRENHEHQKALEHYTEDSVPFNKATANANRGREIGEHDKVYFHGELSDTFDNADRLHKLITSLDPYPSKFKVYVGLSKSTNPAHAEETSEGKKTVHLPAFTSTSLHDLTAMGFAREKPAEKGMNLPGIHDIMAINIPKYHSGGAYIDSHSVNKGEHEYLLSHGHVIEHDAEPKYFAYNNKMYRVWENGNIKGINQNKDWNLTGIEKHEMTPEITSRMEASVIPSVKNRVVHSDYVSGSALENIARNTTDSDTIHAAISHKNMDAPRLKKILDSPMSLKTKIHKAALENPNYGEEHAEQTLYHVPELAEDVLKHPNVPRHVALMASTHSNANLRLGAVLSGKLHPTEIEKMVDDRSPAVSRAAKLASGKLNESITDLMSKFSSIIC